MPMKRNPGTTASAGVFYSANQAVRDAGKPLQGFAPLASPASRVLILGSMPSAASLEQGEYYAHPRNQFWMIMGRLFGAGPDLPYAERCRRLMDCNVAVWDVIARCDRRGSLDSNITEASIVANNLAAFFRRHRRVGFVFFNGRKAEQIYARQTQPQRSLQCRRLPSTSPACATLSMHDKLRQWRVVAECARTPAEIS